MDYEEPVRQPIRVPSSGVRPMIATILALVLFFVGLGSGYFLYPAIQGPPASETWVSIPGVVDTTSVANNTNLTITTNLTLGFTLKYTFENCREKRNYTFKIDFKLKVNFNITVNVTINESRPDAARISLSGNANQLTGKSIRFRFVAARWIGEISAA